MALKSPTKMLRSRPMGKKPKPDLDAEIARLACDEGLDGEQIVMVLAQYAQESLEWFEVLAERAFGETKNPTGEA